jgi:hypothetical protein
MSWWFLIVLAIELGLVALPIIWLSRRDYKDASKTYRDLWKEYPGFGILLKPSIGLATDIPVG